jgi:hypothetical protein
MTQPRRIHAIAALTTALTCLMWVPCTAQAAYMYYAPLKGQKASQDPPPPPPPEPANAGPRKSGRAAARAASAPLPRMPAVQKATPQ